MKFSCVYYLIMLSLVCFIFTCKESNPTKSENVDDKVTGTVTDIDSNVYQTVTIGTQEWMAENLKTTRYNNGDSIPTGLSDDDWMMRITSGAYAIYDNDDTNNSTYGKLYNWYAVDDSCNLCPVGWHVPTDAEWKTLVTYLGGEGVAGGKLKEAGTAHWNSPNAATNESGFTALPGGQRVGHYMDLGAYGFWWSSSEGFGSGSWGWGMVNSENIVMRLNYGQGAGKSVRCIKD